MIAGIDLGTTNSLIGVMDSGFPLLLADADGRRLTPSVVSYASVSDPPLVGRAALARGPIDPANTLSSTKRLIGRRRGEASADELSAAARVAGAEGGALAFETRRGLVTPVDVAAEILRHLRGIASRAMGGTVDEAVITVPAYFNDAQRRATIEAGSRAGLTVRRIVNEPTAAALAHGFGAERSAGRLAVYDLGGGTFDITILEREASVFEVRATSGNTQLGGDDIDDALEGWLMARLGVAGPMAPGDRARLRAEAVRVKHALSRDTECRFSLPFTDGGHLETDVTRDTIERLAAPVLRGTREHCLRALDDAGLAPTDLDAVLLVGGATRMPCVREYAAGIFHREPVLPDNPDETVALGATIQAGILSGQVSNMVLLDVTPLSLGIETFGGLMNVIIPRNTTLPTKAGELFTNAVAGQTAMRISVLQGEREMARDNWPLGELAITFPPAPKGRARVGVQFAIDSDGVLEVLARDTATGAERTLSLDNVVDVGDERVEEMIAGSVEHAFDDLSSRVFTEARLKAGEMLPAVDKALAAVGDSLDADDRRRVLRAMDTVRRAMEGGDANALKAATRELDEATQTMATLLVERAMEDALRRKGAI